MKLLNSIIKFIFYSNLFVSFCTVTLTHLTYIIYNLPQNNLNITLLMVFSFTFFTYNGQRLFRLRKITESDDIGDRLKWVIQHKDTLLISSFFSLLTGLGCLFFINFYLWIILIPMGLISTFYVVPFNYNNSTLRSLPYLKIIFIGIVWSLIIVGLPFIDSKASVTIDFTTSLIQVFLFVIAITIPFDIRDINFDKQINLKTIPNLIGVRNSILLSELLLITSVLLLFILLDNKAHFYALLVGHLITMSIILFTSTKRKELFFAGLVEGTSIILYLCVVISDYLSL